VKCAGENNGPALVILQYVEHLYPDQKQREPTASAGSRIEIMSLPDCVTESFIRQLSHLSVSQFDEAARKLRSKARNPNWRLPPSVSLRFPFPQGGSFPVSDQLLTSDC
jgi:hypothetical protein